METTIVYRLMGLRSLGFRLWGQEFRVESLGVRGLGF